MGALDLGHGPQPANDLDAAKGANADGFQTAQVSSVSDHITRSEKERRRAILDLVCRRHLGATLDIAAAWNVSEQRVRNMRKGRGLLTNDRIRTLPPLLRAAVEALLACPIPTFPPCETTHAQSR